MAVLVGNEIMKEQKPLSTGPGEGQDQGRAGPGQWRSARIGAEAAGVRVDEAGAARPRPMMQTDIQTRNKPRGRLGRDVQNKIGQDCGPLRRRRERRRAGPLQRSCCSNTTNARTRGRANDARPVSARGDAVGSAESARLRDFVVRQCRPRRRPRAGDAAARDRQHQLVPARHQHVGLDVHHPAQSVPLGIPQAPPRGRRHRRLLCGDAQVASGAARPPRVRGIPHGAVATAARPARGADPRRRLRLLLRGSGGDLRGARSAPSRAASIARARGLPICSRSRAPTISARISRPGPSWRPAAAADANSIIICAQKNRPA